jgi:hypothetical protein
MLAETQVKGWELANILKMKTSNLNPILKKLGDIGIICQGDARKSTRERQRHKEGDYKEFPYYLSDDLDNIKIMIRELILSDRILDAGFSLEIVKNSMYMKLMKEKFGEDLTKNIAYEVRKYYPPYADPSFNVIRQRLHEDGLRLPFQEDDLEECLAKNLKRNLGTSSALKRWYNGYLRKYRDQESNSSGKN